LLLKRDVDDRLVADLNPLGLKAHKVEHENGVRTGHRELILPLSIRRGSRLGPLNDDVYARKRGVRPGLGHRALHGFFLGEAHART